jgi:hypothetical protein
MRSYAALALALGLIGALVIEVASARLGRFTALTSWAWIDAIIYMVMTLGFALLFAPLFRRSGRLALPLVTLLFLLLYAPLTGVIAGLVELTLVGGWGRASLVRGALINTPVNLVYTLVLELWFIALPLGVITVLLLWWCSRRGSGVRHALAS